MSQMPYRNSTPSFGIDYSNDAAGTAAIVRFFNSVYAWMAAGLALTAVVAWYVSSQPHLLQTVFGPSRFLFIIVEFGLVLAITWGLNRMNAVVATTLFMIFAGLNGLTLSVLFLFYAKSTLGTTFAITAGTFGITSIYGMATQRDLTKFRSLLYMSLIGLVLASIVNIFVGSTALEWLISYAGVALFVGLTAFDTQRLKMMALQSQGDNATSARLSVYGALVLYLDFINLFIFLLQIFGGNGNGRRR